MKSNASLLYSLFLVIGDFLALVAAFVGGYILRVSFGFGLVESKIMFQVPAITYVEVFALLAPFWILIFAMLGLYNNSIYEKRFGEIGRLFVGSFIGLLFVLGYEFITVESIFPAKLVPFYGFGLAFLFLVMFRNLARVVRGLLFWYGHGLTNVLIIGDTDLADDLAANLHNSRYTGYKVVGVVSSKSKSHVSNIVHFKSFDLAVKTLKTDNIHSIVQTELYADSTRNNEILDFAQQNHVAFRFIPGNTELFVGNIEVELFRNSLPVIAVHQTALIGWGRIIKRLFDIVFGTIFLILAFPIIGFIYLFLTVFDHGDPVFKQTRLSRFGSKIYIYKFRTYYHAYNRMTPEEGFAKMGKPELAKKFRAQGDFLKKDPRISPMGRFLRKTSLDELPQLLNVVKGDLSLVGPRPLEPFELEQYGKKSMILSVKPGLTGLAVVSGRRNISYEERRKLDMYYAQNWSFWMDIVILIKTLRVILHGS